MWDQGKQTVKSSLVLPHQQLHTIISLSYFTDTEIPSRWEKLVINDDTLTTRMQTPDQLNLKLDDVNFYSPRHPPIGRMSVDWSCPLWIITVNLLTIFPMLGHMVLRAWHIALCLPLPGKAMKLSFPLHPELCLWDLTWHCCTEKLNFQHQISWYSSNSSQEKELSTSKHSEDVFYSVLLQ